MNLVAIANVESYLEGHGNTRCLIGRSKPYYAPVSDEVEEGGEGAGGVVAHVLELGDELLAQLVVDDGDLQRRRHVGQEVAVVGRLQVQLQVWKQGGKLCSSSFQFQLAFPSERPSYPYIYPYIYCL